MCMCVSMGELELLYVIQTRLFFYFFVCISYLDDVPLADLDKNVGSEGNDHVQHVLDGACTNHSEGLPTVVHDGTNSKGRKLIIKTKSGKEPVLGATPVHDDSKPKGCKLRIKLKPPKESASADVGLGGDDVSGMVRDDHSDGRKKKKEKEKGENRRSRKGRKAEKGEIKTQVKKRGERERGMMRMLRLKRCGKLLLVAILRLNSQVNCSGFAFNLVLHLTHLMLAM